MATTTDLPSQMHPPEWSVQGLAEKQDLDIPSQYVQDFSDNVFPVAMAGDGGIVDQVPVIDFKRIQEGDTQERATFFKAIDEWGFCQLVNHQLTPGVLNHALDLCRNFFQLPFSEKLHYCAPDPNKNIAFGYGRVIPFTEINGKADWGDCLAMNGNDLVSSKEKLVDLTKWKQLPEAYREGISKFARETHNLGLKLLSLLTHNLGIAPVEESYGDIALGLSTIVYPVCPRPELVMGLRAHADPNFITLLVQDKPGLQVLKDGRWVTVKPIEDAIVVNVGDQFEILTNGKYKSVVHRVTVSDQFTRYSLGSFLGPMDDAVINSDPKLVDEEHPARYKPQSSANFYTTSMGSIASRNDELSILSAAGEPII